MRNKQKFASGVAILTVNLDSPEAGLTLQYQPYGEIACLFAVR